MLVHLTDAYCVLQGEVMCARVAACAQCLQLGDVFCKAVLEAIFP